MSAVELCEKLVAFAALLQTVELIGLKRYWVDSGVWSWKTLAHDYDSSPVLKKTLTVFLNERSFAMLLLARMLASLMALALSANAWVLGILFFSSWLISIRWRGTLNGGSDSMTLVVALSVWISAVFRDHPLITLIALGYVAVQLTASYWIAGSVKLNSRAWRKGTALAQFFKTPGYDSPPDWVRSLFQQPTALAKFFSLLIIAFECLFPLAWLHPRICMAFLACAIIFHVMNFFVFGLNRFVFAWLAAYPALLFWSERILERSQLP